MAICIVCSLGQCPALAPLLRGAPRPPGFFPHSPAVWRSPVLIYVAGTADFLVPSVHRCGLDASPGWVVRPSVGLSAGCRPSSPRALLLFPLPPCVCPSGSGTQKVGLPKSEFLAPATRLWSRFRPSSTLPSNSLAVQRRVLLREKVTFGPFGWVVGIFFFFFFRCWFFERAFL